MQAENETNVSASFAASLAAVIKRSGLTKHAFANEVGISHTAISNYLAGRPPKLEEASRIAAKAGMSIDAMIGTRATIDSHVRTSNGESREASDAEHWQRRAVTAEQKLAELHADLAAAIKKISS